LQSRSSAAVADPLRIGVIGIGALALRGILPHLSQEDVQDRALVGAVCDPVVERAEAAAAIYDVPQVFASVDEMLSGAAIDAVTVASPIGLHYGHCRAALEARKHVHVNKTMTTTVEEADALLALARRHDLRLVASPGDVLLPQVTRTRELIETNAIGEVCWAICGSSFGDYHEQEIERRDAPGGAPIDPTWYFRAPGGGPMYDMTVYALHQLTSVLGPAKAVSAVSGTRIRERSFSGARIKTEIDDNTMLLLDFGDGLCAVAYGVAAGSHSDQFPPVVYFGTHGSIEGVLLNGEPFDFAGQHLVTGPPTRRSTHMRVLPHVRGVHRDLDESHVFEDIMQLVDWALDGTPSPVSADHARHVVDIIDSGYRAARTGLRQELATSFDLTPLGTLQDVVERREGRHESPLRSSR
jgi:predicted dehydrogenase